MSSVLKADSSLHRHTLGLAVSPRGLGNRLRRTTSSSEFLDLAEKIAYQLRGDEKKRSKEQKEEGLEMDASGYRRAAAGARLGFSLMSVREKGERCP